MRLTLHTKVYLVTVFLALTLGAGMYWLTQNSLKSGLLERASQTSLKQFDKLAAIATAHYTRVGHWRQIQEQPRIWQDMRHGVDHSDNSDNPGSNHSTQRGRRDLNQGFRPSNEIDRGRKNDSRGFHPPRDREHRSRDEDRNNRITEDRDRNQRPERHRRGELERSDSDSNLRRPPRRGPRGRPIDGGINIALLDSNKDIVAGHLNPRESRAVRPLYSGEGESPDNVIGYLAINHPRQLTDSLDLEFQRQQLEAFIPIIAIICGALMVISLPLARRLTTPIIGLQKQTHQLAKGDFDVRSKHHSSDELGDLARDFNSLAETLANNESMRRRWVADISHELRTPIAVIKGHIEAIQDGVRPSTPKTWTTLHTKIEQLSRLVSDLHQLSLADSGSLKYYKSSFLAFEFLEDFCETFSAPVRHAGIDFSSNLSIPDDIELYADPGRITQLLSNLLENSIKYTDSGGSIALAANIQVKSAKQQLLIVIEDSTPGVPDEELKHLFERLYRVDSSRNRSTGGAGLGLSLCRSIVAAHQGDIHASHSSLGGLRIELSFELSSKENKAS